MRLADRTALITGAGNAFGAALAVGFAREGAALALVDESGADLTEVAAQVRGLGRPIAVHLGDLTHRQSVVSLVEAAVHDLGRIDILVNATGRSHNQAFLDFPEEDFEDCLAIGLKSHFLFCQAVGRHMAERRSGKIINLTSIIGRIGSGQAAGWSAAKGGGDAMTRSIAQALGYHGITVNSLARGAQVFEARDAAAKRERLRRMPLGRLGAPEDLVGPALFLASDDSAYVTGHVLYADGGYTTAAVTDDRNRPTWARADATRVPD